MGFPRGESRAGNLENADVGTGSFCNGPRGYSMSVAVHGPCAATPAPDPTLAGPVSTC